MGVYSIISPGSFEPANHWYQKALNATIHPLVAYFLNLSKSTIVERYCHLHPAVDKAFLFNLLTEKTKYFKWAGADLINVTTENGNKQMVVIENNSCPSGQKSMPLLNEHDEMGGYRTLIQETFLPHLKEGRSIKDGVLAVIYDKNPMEASGYAAAIAELMDEKVYFIYFPTEGYESYLRYTDGILQLKTKDEEWINVAAAFRYVTQKPWTRIPLDSKTKILNPILSCIAGGRNKMIAAKAYDLFNSEIEQYGLKINMPETIWDVSKNEIPIWVKKLGGQAVIKVPYSNAGQGVFTIVSPKELDAFMAQEFTYDRFIVQSLIGNYNWSSTSTAGKLFHVGTMPSLKGHTYVHDVRIMVSSTESGIIPLVIYGRRAEFPLVDNLVEGQSSWDILGTNLSIKQDDNSWGSDTNRLLLMDRRDFNKLGLGIDDLIEGYIQTVLSMKAIDSMCKQLVNKNGKFRRKLFKSLNDDEALIGEMMLDQLTGNEKTE